MQFATNVFAQATSLSLCAYINEKRSTDDRQGVKRICIFVQDNQRYATNLRLLTSDDGHDVQGPDKRVTYRKNGKTH